MLPGEGTPLLPANHLVSLHEREGEERGVRGKGADGGEGRFVAGFILLMAMPSWLPGEEVKNPTVLSKRN